MKLPQPYKCDIHPCEKIKGENNHWFLIEREGIRGDDQFTVYPWDDITANESSDSIMHVCSEECAIRALSQWLGRVK